MKNVRKEVLSIGENNRYQVGDVVAVGNTAVVMICRIYDDTYSTVTLLPGGCLKTGEYTHNHTLSYNTSGCRKVTATLVIEEDK